MASAAALKMAAICMLVMCVGSQMAAHASPDRDAAAGALLQELMEHDIAEKLGLIDDNVGDICTPACQNCLIVCAINCILKPEPVACYAGCIVKDGCFPKTMVANKLRGRPQGGPCGGAEEVLSSLSVVIDSDN